MRRFSEVHEMNERIRELAEQAGMHDFVLEAMGIGEEFEKFAELIVQECATYAFSDDQDRRAMLKHFGVEE
jgi:hypothetical protein